MGILFAFGALIAWGIGDFLIQRSARKFGDWVALFYITAFAAIALLPFVHTEVRALVWNGRGLAVGLIAAAVAVGTSYCDFEALRIGKISVVEPIYAFEIAITAGLASLIAREHLSPVQIALVALVVLGIFLVSAKSLRHMKDIRWEKGVILAVAAMIGLGAMNFLFGLGARYTNPLLINWFTSVIAMFFSLCVLAKRGQLKNIVSDLKDNGRLILSVSFIDNLAWIFFCYAVLYIPIAVATSISEGYIALGAILGLQFNREKLKLHQKIGLVFAIFAAIALAAVTKG